MTAAARGTDNYFKIDPECHLIGDMEPLNPSVFRTGYLKCRKSLP